jgi:hypothetical protein
MGMNQAEAKQKVAALIHDAAELAILTTQIMIVLRASKEDDELLLKPVIERWAQKNSLTLEEAWSLFGTVTDRLILEPWAHYILAPPGHGRDTDLARYIRIDPKSNQELRDALERGLEKHSFDREPENDSDRTTGDPLKNGPAG